MGNFNCDKCGHTWFDHANFTSCPNCFGAGERDEKCTCLHWAGPMGQKTNVIHTEDPNCPVHPKKDVEIVLVQPGASGKTVEQAAERTVKYLHRTHRSVGLIGSGHYCPDCGGLCGNEKHTRRW